MAILSPIKFHSHFLGWWEHARMLRGLQKEGSTSHSSQWGSQRGGYISNNIRNIIFWSILFSNASQRNTSVCIVWKVQKCHRGGNNHHLFCRLWGKALPLSGQAQRDCPATDHASYGTRMVTPSSQGIGRSKPILSSETVMLAEFLPLPLEIKPTHPYLPHVMPFVW